VNTIVNHRVPRKVSNLLTSRAYCLSSAQGRCSVKVDELMNVFLFWPAFCTRDGTKAMSPFFHRKCNCSNNEIYVGDSYMFCSYGAI
jgi:hypothetical protein